MTVSILNKRSLYIEDVVTIEISKSASIIYFKSERKIYELLQWSLLQQHRFSRQGISLCWRVNSHHFSLYDDKNSEKNNLFESPQLASKKMYAWYVHVMTLKSPNNF